MAYISQANLELIRDQPEKFGHAYSLVAAQIRVDLGGEYAAMSDDGFIAVFASQVAYDMKPYAGSTATTLKDLLAADGLDCDNYARLAHQLFRLARPVSSLRWYMVGWDYGAVGNHAQVFVYGTGCPLMLDPTIGAVGKSAYTNVAKSIPIPALRFLPNSRPVDSSISDFKAAVTNALLSGLYQPHDLLYFFDMDKPKLEQEIVNRAKWPTPAVEINT
jgi:hypothetical protein